MERGTEEREGAGEKVGASGGTGEWEGTGNEYVGKRKGF